MSGVCFVIWIGVEGGFGEPDKEIHAVAESPQRANEIAAEYGRGFGYVRCERPGGRPGVYELWGWKKPATRGIERWIQIEEFPFFPAHPLEKLATSCDDET